MDPDKAKARILKVEYFHPKGSYASERAELDKARATGTTDSWLLVGYGRFFRRMNDLETALHHYSEARLRGPGTGLEQRNAYVASLNGLASLAAQTAEEGTLRQLIQATRDARGKRDARALGELARPLVIAGMFDEAIGVAREALQTMNYGVGRLTLTAALFGKAAELRAAGKPRLAAPFLKEARGYGSDRESVLGYFAYGTPS